MTIKEIAKMAGISITAVSFYLNEKQNKLSKDTIKKLDQIMEETGYKPSRIARDLRLQKTNKVAIIVFDISQDFAQEAFKAISNELKNEDLVFSLYESHLDFEREKNILLSLIESKAHSIVIQPSKEMLNYLPTISRNFPNIKTKIILIDSKGKNKKYGYVYSDSDADIEEQVKLKADQGAKVFYYISDEIEKLQIREYRFSRLKRLTKKYKIELKTITSQNDVIKDEDIHASIKGQKNIKKVFWANNAEVAFNTYKYLDANNQINNKNSIVVFNKCYFKPIVKVQLDHIDSHISKMGIEAANQIRTNRVGIKKIN